MSISRLLVPGHPSCRVPSTCLLAIAAALAASETAALPGNPLEGAVALVPTVGTAGHASAPAISRDGRFVAFGSDAPNIISGDSNGVSDVFVYDRRSRVTVRVSVASDGAAGNCASSHPGLSGNGRFVAFRSCATNLVSSDTNGTTDVFLHDRDSDEDGVFDEPGAVDTTRLSVSSDGAQADRERSEASAPVLSADARFTVFDSAATTLVEGDTNGHTDIFVHDRLLSTTRRLSVSDAGIEGDGESRWPSVSADGRYVSFTSGASNLASGDVNSNCPLGGPGSNCYDIFVRDRNVDADGEFDERGAVETSLVSVATDGAPGNDVSGVSAITADGRYVAFHATAAPGGFGDPILLRDRLAQETHMIWWIPVGLPYGYDLSEVRIGISADGKTVTFNSWVSLPDDGNGVADVFAYDRSTNRAARLSRRYDSSWDHAGGLSPDGVSGAPTIDDSGMNIVFLSEATNIVAQDTNGARDVFVHSRDAEMDGLPDVWERQFGLSATSDAGEDGPGGDPDHDGHSNAEEWAAGSHPRGFFNLYLAEGAETALFTSRVPMLNTSGSTALANVRLLRHDAPPLSYPVSVAPHALHHGLVELPPSDHPTEFSVLIESDVRLFADRTMRWDRTDDFGGHSAEAVEAPSTVWYFAEGATQWKFDLFYLLQNPNETPAEVEITFLTPHGTRAARYEVDALSRTTVWVDTIAGLENTDVAAAIRSLDGRPIVAERAMYLSSPNQLFTGGHASVGVTSPATEWYLAEGATGIFFDTFILIANFTDTAAHVRATYFLPDGTTVVRFHTVAAMGRHNIWVDLDDPALADTAVSALLESTNGVPIVVERSMWWPGPTADTWQEAHNAMAVRAAGVEWAIAEGFVGGPHVTDTYLLVMNPSDDEAVAQITLYFADGSTAAKPFTIGPRRRLNVPVGFLDAGFGTVSWNKPFGAVVESLGEDPAPLVVEWSMYWNGGGIPWGAGTCAPAVKVR